MRNVLSLISFPGPTQRYETYCLIFVFHHIHNLIISKWKRVEAHPTHFMLFHVTFIVTPQVLILLLQLCDFVTPHS